MVVSHFGKSDPRFGESDLRIYDKDYVKVDGQLIHRYAVWLATEENMRVYNEYKKFRLEAEAEIDHRMFEAMNKMERQDKLNESA